MRKRDWRKTVALAANSLTGACRPVTFPVNLSRLAAERGVQRVRFRRMPIDGALKVIPSGFEVQIRSNKEQSVPVSEVDSSALTLRERFTYAHEIGHTFFFNSELRPLRPQPRRQLRESLCNYGGGCLLMPEFLVKREIGQGCVFNSLELALNLADVARVSATVAVRRLDELDGLKVGDYALILLEPNAEDVLLTTAVFLSGALSGHKKPELYAEPPAWVRKLAPGAFDGSGTVRRVPYDHRWDYVSRVVSNPKRPAQLLAEVRLLPTPEVGTGT